MATTAPIDIGTLIAKSPQVKSGRPVITGTGVMVMRIVGWYKQGWIPEEIASRMGLDMAQVHAALAYYYANREEIEADIADEQAAYEQYKQEYRREHLERGA